MPSPSNSDSKVPQGFCFGSWLVFSVCVVWGVFKGEKKWVTNNWIIRVNDILWLESSYFNFVSLIFPNFPW